MTLTATLTVRTLLVRIGARRVSANEKVTDSDSQAANKGLFR